MYVNNCPVVTQVNCRTYWQIYPSHPYQGQFVTLNFENPNGATMKYQLWDVTRSRVVEELTSTGINVQINTSNLGIGTYYVYDISEGLKNCGTWDQFVVCSID